MKGRVFLYLSIAVVAAAAVPGCATQPAATAEEPPPSAQLIGDEPQIRLPGATRAEAKSVALGTAHSKGWILVEETPDRVVLQRPMDPAAPQAVALGAAAGMNPIVQVTSYFVEEPGGVLVALRAEVLAQGPAQSSEPLDYTEAYRSDLMRSLRTLSETWAANRQRVAAALHWTRSPAQSPQIPYPYGDPNAGLEGVPEDPLRAAWASGTTLVDEKAAGSDAAGPSGAASSGTLPTDDRPRPSAPGAGTAAISAWGTANAAVPSPSGSGAPPSEARPAPGIWSYYAEQFARTRGCALTNQGAVLVERPPGAEILEVPCRNLPTFRLRCHNGVCRQLN